MSLLVCACACMRLFVAVFSVFVLLCCVQGLFGFALFWCVLFGCVCVCALVCLCVLLFVNMRVLRFVVVCVGVLDCLFI